VWSQLEVTAVTRLAVTFDPTLGNLRSQGRTPQEDLLSGQDQDDSSVANKWVSCKTVTNRLLIGAVLKLGVECDRSVSGSFSPGQLGNCSCPNSPQVEFATISANWDDGCNVGAQNPGYY
jgi:hypothetical protein